MKWFLTLACICCAETVAASDSNQRPNVVIFLVDDLGYGDLAAHGNPHVETPHFDAFARDGVELTRFYVSPVCHPSRASLMTGRYTARTFQEVSFHMHPDELTVAEILRGAGYRTGLFGKWHLGNGPHESPIAQGFDEVLTLRAPGGELVPEDYFDPQLVHNGRQQKYRGYCMDVFTDKAIAFVKENPRQPFFVYLSANLIHFPLIAPPKLWVKYAAMGLNDRLAATYGMVESTDSSFGRIRAALQELGLEENTLLIFTSDNGGAIYSAEEIERDAGLHGLKGTVYEGGIRVPCVIRWPAAFQGRKQVNRHAAHIDILPTILEACGVAAPENVKLDGKSLLPLLREPEAPWPDRMLFIQCNSNGRPTRELTFAAISERWKLVQPEGIDEAFDWLGAYSEISAAQGRGNRTVTGGVPRFELYDLVTDPGERHDLAAKHPEVVRELRRQYNVWFRDIEAHGRWNR